MYICNKAFIDIQASVYHWRPSADGRPIHRHAVAVVLTDGKDNLHRKAGNLVVASEAVVS